MVYRSARPLVEQLEDRRVPANAVPAIASLHAELTAPNGSTVRLTGSFTDADADDPHSVLIDWQDGSARETVALTPGTRTFQVTHFYTSQQTAQDSLRSIGVIVTDQAFGTQVTAVSGSFDNGDFRDPSNVLGEPTRFTNPAGQFGGAVTPFNPPFGPGELLTLNQGESVTIKFPVQVHDNPPGRNGGSDFLIFGNDFYILNFDTDRATGLDFEEMGRIEVSQDGVTFFDITTPFPDTPFPTNGYQNPTGNFDLPPTNPIFSDFGRPVDLSFDETGLTLEQIVAAYNGSGGGLPVDIAGTGLSWIQYVRIHGADFGVEIDALSVVNPLPEAVTVGSFSTSGVDEELGLYVDAKGFFQGTSGTSVKWLRGGTINVHGNDWYFLQPTGDLLAWTGKRNASGKMVARGTVVAHFDPDVFVHPALLYNGSLASLPTGEAATARTLDESLGLYVGADGFEHGSIGREVKWLRGAKNSFNNDWYFINRSGDLFAWNGSRAARGQLVQAFDSQLFLDPQLLHDASEATLSPTDAVAAQQFDETLGLFVDDAGFFPKVKGTDEKWLRGENNSAGNPWYFLRSNGDFVAWDGTKRNGKMIASGVVLRNFDDQVFLDPQLLYLAAQPALTAEQTLQARQFQDMLGLFVDADGFYPKVRGTDAKWLRGQPNAFGTTWYFVNRSGQFVAWSGAKDGQGRMIAAGTILYTFPVAVFLNPEPLL